MLGDLSVALDGETRLVTAARQRCALAILLLSPNRTVSSVALIDGIWGPGLPQHPDTALQIVVSRLRASLGSAAGRLVSVPSGYRIDVEPGELDVEIAQHALAASEELRRAHDPERAASVAAEALARWSAEPLHDLVAFPFCAAARARLRDLRISLYEVHNAALLEAARHVEVLETIERWIAEQPWRERLRAQHMLALYRSGRQVEALRAYDEYRERLVDELGVEPSRELRELHRDVLSHAPALAATPCRPVLGTRIPLWTSMALPFVGRTVEQNRIFDHIRDASAGVRTMVLIDGEAGIGKTRLVLEVARRVQDDAVIMAVTANDALRPPVVGYAEALVEAMSALDDEQLRAGLGPEAPLLAAAVPTLAARFPDLAPGPDDVGFTLPRLAKAVIACTASLSTRGPVVLLLDDLHRAGVEFLILLGRLLVAEPDLRLVVLATSRSPAPDRSSSLADLADQLGRRGLLDRMQLSGLPLASVERLLVRLGFADASASAPRLHDATGGHPFFVGEILKTGDWQRALVDLPAGVKEFVRRRVHALGDAAEQVLVDAAGLTIAFDVELLSAIAEVPPATTENLIDGAVAAGVLRTVDKSSFTFVHELCRRALLDRLDDGERDRLHDRIARALDGRSVPPALLEYYRHRVPATPS